MADGPAPTERPVRPPRWARSTRSVRPARSARLVRLPGQRGMAVVLAALLLAATAACGGDGEQEDYCASFLERRQELSDLTARQSEAAKDGEGVDVLSPTLAAFEDLRSQAPTELRDEWDTLVFAYRDLAEAVESSGLDPVEFQVGEVPEGLAPADRKVLSRVASKLGAPRVVEAASGIEGYSAQVCEDGGDGGEDGGVEDVPTEEP